MIETNRHLFRRLTWSAALLVAAAAWLMVDPGVRGTARADEMSQEEFDARVRDYLLAHPEVILEAVQRLQERQDEAAAQAAQAAIAERADEILNDPASPVGGNPDGDVTLVEFFDYNCTYCRRVAPVMAEAVAADPGLRIVYKEFPILGEGSAFAARAALAAARQGRYLEFHDALMGYQGTVDEGVTLAVAADIGLDLDRLQADMADPAILAAIDRTYDLASALQINGTPGFVIGETIIPGAVDLAALQAAIGEARVQQ
jgi:protein-disulfide isomerase